MNSDMWIPSAVLAPRNRNRILIVDDERSIRRLFEMVLAAELPEHLIDSAEDGSQALEVFRRHHHGLLLLDLKMPVMDGRAAFTEIERACFDANWEMPSVVFCTGYTPPDAVRRVVEASGDFHALIAKPVSNDTLVDVVKSRLQQR